MRTRLSTTRTSPVATSATPKPSPTTPVITPPACRCLSLLSTYHARLGRPLECHRSGWYARNFPTSFRTALDLWAKVEWNRLNLGLVEISREKVTVERLREAL